MGETRRLSTVFRIWKTTKARGERAVIPTNTIKCDTILIWKRFRCPRENISFCVQLQSTSGLPFEHEQKPSRGKEHGPKIKFMQVLQCLTQWNTEPRFHKLRSNINLLLLLLSLHCPHWNKFLQPHSGSVESKNVNNSEVYWVQVEWMNGKPMEKRKNFVTH